MQQNNFFYIVDHSGQIFEIKYTPERIAAAISAWKSKGIFTVEGLGAVLNGANFAKVIDEAQYKNFLSTVRPHEYPANGVWYNRKHEVLRLEPWKQEIKDKQKRLQAKPTETIEETPEQREKTNAIGRTYLESLRKGINKMPS